MLRPPVDIFEDAQGIMVVAELPGVSKDGLNVHGDRNNLVIEGDVSIDMPADMEAVYADVQSTPVCAKFRAERRAGDRRDRRQPEGRCADPTHPEARRIPPVQNRSPHRITFLQAGGQ